MGKRWRWGSDKVADEEEVFFTFSKKKSLPLPKIKARLYLLKVFCCAEVREDVGAEHY